MQSFEFCLKSGSTRASFSAAVAAVRARGAGDALLGDVPVARDVGRQLAHRQGRHQLQDDARRVAERGGE